VTENYIHIFKVIADYSWILSTFCFSFCKNYIWHNSIWNHQIISNKPQHLQKQ